MNIRISLIFIYLITLVTILWASPLPVSSPPVITQDLFSGKDFFFNYYRYASYSSTTINSYRFNKDKTANACINDFSSSMIFWLGTWTVKDNILLVKEASVRSYFDKIDDLLPDDLGRISLNKLNEIKPSYNYNAYILNLYIIRSQKPFEVYVRKNPYFICKPYSILGSQRKETIPNLKKKNLKKGSIYLEGLMYTLPILSDLSLESLDVEINVNKFKSVLSLDRTESESKNLLPYFYTKEAASSVEFYREP